MMKLVALRQIRSGTGTIEKGQPFDADEHLGLRWIDEGAAMSAAAYSTRPWDGRGYWRVTPDWQGETVAILGGGPSLTPEQIDVLGNSDPDTRTIAINNAIELAPWADILYFCDDRWYEWHKEAVHAFGGMRVTLENLKLQNEIEVRSLRDYGVAGFAPKPDGVTNGRNSGYQALHLAAWLGVKRVLLLGYDMREVNGRMHWHDEHPVATPANIFPGWIAAFDALAPILEARGVEVINCTPDSAVKAFKTMTLEAALAPAMHEQPAAPAPDEAKLALFSEENPVPIKWTFPPVPEAQPGSPAAEPERGGEFGGAGASSRWDDENASAAASDTDSKPDPEAA